MLNITCYKYNFPNGARLLTSAFESYFDCFQHSSGDERYQGDKTVDELFLFHAEDEDDEHNYYSLVKDFELYDFDYERYYDDEYIYEELTEEQRKNFEEKSLLRIFSFGTDYILTTDDVEKCKGKTLNHKIANYVIQDLS